VSTNAWLELGHAGVSCQEESPTGEPSTLKRMLLNDLKPLVIRPAGLTGMALISALSLPRLVRLQSSDNMSN